MNTRKESDNNQIDYFNQLINDAIKELEEVKKVDSKNLYRIEQLESTIDMYANKLHALKKKI